MGTVHDLLETHGKQVALNLDLDRATVEAASTYLADEDTSIGYLFSSWTQAALPHKKLADDQIWEIRTERVTLLVEPGRKPNPIEGLSPLSVGVPFGSRARLIMLYLQTEALKSSCREVELGRSLRSWFTRLGIAPGGKSIREVRERRCQVDRRRVLMTSGRLRCLCDISNCGDLAPGAEGSVAGGTVFNGGEAMAAELEMVVDAGVGGQEALGVAR